MQRPRKAEENFGEASYVQSRHRKNQVIQWLSQVHPNRVYEFILASRFKTPGLVSWKCQQCQIIREQRKKDGASLDGYKVPLILVDNNVIREDPDRPFNSQHFCAGLDLVDANVSRSKLQFYEQIKKQETIDSDNVMEEFSNHVIKACKNLNAYQREQVLQTSFMKRHQQSLKRRVSRMNQKRRQGFFNEYDEKFHPIVNGVYISGEDVVDETGEYHITSPSNKKRGRKTATYHMDDHTYNSASLQVDHEECVVQESQSDEYIDVEADDDDNGV